MTPFEKYGLQRGWDTVLLIGFIITTMVLCTLYVGRTIASNGAKSQIILTDTMKSLGVANTDRASNQKNLNDHLEVIGQRDQLIIDRLTFQQTLLDDLRKRGK
jgi:hypothetical protein